MIPKVIHYCWFGGNELPDLALRCIESWKNFFPDYQIKEWNESNFDLNACDYVREAYEAKKWAFVSDYARYWILYHEGGLYFDTDVEVIKSMEDILEKGAFMGCEPIEGGADNGSGTKVNCAPGLGLGVNPGLGLGVNPGLGLLKEILDFYNSIHFKREDGTLNITTIVKYTTDILKKHGWIPDGNLQCVEKIYIYPVEYFSPMDYATGHLNITENTRSIHHYASSWISEADRKYHRIRQCLQSRFGHKIGNRLGRIIDFPHRVKVKMQEKGLVGTLKFAMDKIGAQK